MSANNNSQVNVADASSVSNVHVVYRPITHNANLVQESVNLSSESIAFAAGRLVDTLGQASQQITDSVSDTSRT